MKTMVTFLTLVVLSMTVNFAAAQDPYNFRADRKISPQNYRPHSARTYSGNGVRHAQTLQYFGKNYETISPETAKEHATGVRQNLDSFTKEIDKLAKDVAVTDDAEAMKLIASIRNHQKKAAEHCGMVEAECAKHEVKGSSLINCCSDMLKDLRAAHDAHEKLLKYLKIPVATEDASEQPKK